MICTPEFIKVYNRTFEFILNNLGYEGLVGYWRTIAPIALEKLASSVKDGALAGVRYYWDDVLCKENAIYSIDCQLPYSEELTLNIYECPSLKILGDDICEYYCDHCTTMYKPIFEERGYDYSVERKDRGCRIRITRKKSASLATEATPAPAST